MIGGADSGGASLARCRRRPASRALRLLGRIGVSIPRASTTTAPTAATRRCGARSSSAREGVIREVLDSKLMGRGGAAFPTGRKWEAVARQPRRPHYLVCNADESEPGTFKDRVLMEGDPFAVIEAMTIAAYATGCERGYHLPARRVSARAAATRARDRRRPAQRGCLGDDILGRGLRVRHRAAQGAGAYICGEETAIFNSIEGYRGEPRNKPPFPVERGLFGKPTVVNNVETLVNVLADPARRRRGVCRASAPSGRPGRSCSASPGPSRSRASTRCRSARRCGELLELAGGVPGRRPPARRAARRRRGQVRRPGRARAAADVRGHSRAPARRSARASWSRSTSTSTSATC